MFIDEPRLEGTEQNRCSHTSQQSANEKNLEIRKMLQMSVHVTFALHDSLSSPW